MGLPYEIALDLPVRVIVDLKHIEQVKHEGAKLRGTDGESYTFIAE